MRKISTGEDSTLRTWRKIAFFLDGAKCGSAVAFIDKKIEESPNGEDEEVIADESQLICALAYIANNDSVDKV